MSTVDIIRTQVRLPKPLYARLRRERERRAAGSPGVSLNDLICESLDRALPTGAHKPNKTQQIESTELS